MRAFLDFPARSPGDTDPALATRWRAQFADPLALLTAWRLDEVEGVLQQVQAQARAGRWCVGEVAYEAAGAFDAALTTHAARPDWPLARFAVYADALAWPPGPTEQEATHSSERAAAHPLPQWLQTTSYPDYAARVEQARAAMAAGECYQVNLTEALQARLEDFDVADFAAWFDRLRRAQPGGYQAWLDWSDSAGQQVLSLSPELFFDWQPDGAEGLLTCQPMKGTASRHADPLQDAQARLDLLKSEKERAENVMIVDLLRNDMGRVAQPGSVRVSRLFEVQALPTVWQMTSTITARTRSEVGLPELFAALFPCGSVTGAPKARAMHWIRALEQGPRGVYCGAVGVVRPGGAATFNVPIRTVTLAREQERDVAAAAPLTSSPSAWRAHYGVGSAITFYAEPQAEWQELSAKTRFLERAMGEFELLETLRLQDGKYDLLAQHLARMGASAAYFAFVWRADVAQACLTELAHAHPQGGYRVRLTWSHRGVPRAQAFVLERMSEPIIFNLSAMPLETLGREHEFVVHKTTRRAHYTARLRPAPGVFDTLLVNERGELTEFTRGNVALKIDNQWITPALHCGLLAGTCRAELLARGQITEAVLGVADLQRAQEVAFFNSVRGWLRAQLQADPAATREVGNHESTITSSLRGAPRHGNP